MYFQKLFIKNCGPISELLVQAEFTADGLPKPLVLIGQNGSGKTIFLSNIVNALIATKQTIFNAVEVQKDKVYKVRSPLYIQSGCNYYNIKLDFSDGLYFSEWQLSQPKGSFETEFGIPIEHLDWDKIAPNDTSCIYNNLTTNPEYSNRLVKNSCNLYFPSNRFEEPGWLNLDSLLSTVEYTDLKKLSGYSNRNIVAISPLKQNQRWLLDVLFDRNVLEVRQKQVVSGLTPGGAPIFQQIWDYHGPAASIYTSILQMLGIILQTNEKLRFGINDRRNRQIVIMKNEISWIPNLFQLSTGQSLLLNIFLSIIRDYDLTNNSIESLSDIKGIVVIDEIDAHLHISMQRDVLPKLMQLFPRIQFIVTTHSPVFLSGLEKAYGNDGCSIIELPIGNSINADEFLEYDEMFSSLEGSRQVRTAIAEAVLKREKPSVFVEGDYDIGYIRAAAKFHGREDLLSRFELVDGEGFGNLNNIWKSVDSKICLALTKHILLLYDCDIEKSEKTSGKACRIVMPHQSSHPIIKGVENLFPSSTIDKLEKYKPEFIDHIDKHFEIKRGKKIEVPASKAVNKDEKRNICDYLCLNGSLDDFRHFIIVLDQIEHWLAGLPENTH